MVKMIALQTVYVFSQRKEYREGATFDVADAGEAAGLQLAKKARRAVADAPDKPRHVDLPKVETKDEVADGPKKSGGRGRYQRRDMTATDGQTGEEIPLPSSLLDPQPEEQTSTNSEADPE